MQDPSQHTAPDREPLDGLFGYHIRRLSVIVMADLAASLAPLRLKPADASVLLTIGSRPGLTQSEVGRSLGIQRANMAPLIGALIKRGLVERMRLDGRSQALRLTARGLELSREVGKVLKCHEDRLFGSLRASVRRTLIRHLRALWRGAH